MQNAAKQALAACFQSRALDVFTKSGFMTAAADPKRCAVLESISSAPYCSVSLAHSSDAAAKPSDPNYYEALSEATK
jgi:hypothetical protein